MNRAGPIVSRCDFTHPGVPTIPKKFLESGTGLLEELDAPSSIAEFDLMQATLESETKDAGKMEGGSLREFTRFLEKMVRIASPHTHSHESNAPRSNLAEPRSRALLSQDPKHKWADFDRALLPDGQSVWCCKGCIGIIKEDTNATYEEIRVKVKAKAPPLPELTGEPATPLRKAAEVAAAAAKPTVWWSCFKFW